MPVLRFSKTLFPSVLGLILSIAATYAAPHAKAQTPQQLGFTQTQGGIEGQVLKVTNLNEKGPGSLREAIQTKGPRIVVFEVGGVIDLKKRHLSIAEPHLTIAGQTAPSPGITLIRGGVMVKTHDVVIQHLCFRPGDAGAKKKSGWEPDGLTTTGPDAHDIIIDHCSFSWAVDENLSASGPRLEGPEGTSRQVTFSNCLIAEALHDSSHSKGGHSKGMLIHDYCRDIAIVGNLFAHNVDRNPLFKGHTAAVVTNNVIYNPQSVAIRSSYAASEWKNSERTPEYGQFSIVGNVLFHGSNTRKELPLVTGRGKAFLKDNLAFDREARPLPIAAKEIELLKEPPLWPENLSPLPAEQVVEHMLQNVGARPWDRNAIDRRILQQFVEREGKIIHSQDEVGGYPTSPPTQRSLEVPPAGRIAEWLQKMEQ